MAKNQCITVHFTTEEFELVRDHMEVEVALHSPPEYSTEAGPEMVAQQEFQNVLDSLNEALPKT